jgi:type VI secretion system protein VasG
VTLITYFPLGDDIIRRIVELQLGRVRDRIATNYRAGFTYDPALVDQIAARCRETESGARNVESMLTRGILPDLSARFLDRMSKGEPITSVHLAAEPSGGIRYDVV